MAPEYSRRTTFDKIAADYDQVRPGYPAESVEDVISMAALPETGRILEIGCGTGQATIAFARRGFSMTCLDVGQELAARAARNCRKYPNVQVLCKSFEDWRPAGKTFDLVMSASAFHWVPPEIGYPKAARVLGKVGSVALLSNLHPLPYTGFFHEVQTVYRKFVPEWRDTIEGPTPEEAIPLTQAHIAETGLFGPASIRVYAWARLFCRDDYLRLLNTYSDHRALADEQRTRLFAAIGDLIDSQYGGEVTRPYLTVLHIARKKEI
ncbi:MAG: class I SAM-dependent methyltransferase [Elusimicrobia bacterium]|nr:class I SAM-dependent methyltransferase [Elusimicrobiota bacterium]